MKNLSATLLAWLMAPVLLAQVSLNVTNFGAQGDAVQFYVNTVSNSVVVTTTNQLSESDIGKTIEVFRVGKPTYGANSYGVTTNDWQDLIGTITNVIDATNIYISVKPQDLNVGYVPQRTASGVWATYGTDNTVAFSNTIAAAASYTNITINIPNGTYLLMPIFKASDRAYYGSICLHRGGLHFKGESQDNTILLSRGAWQIKNTQDGSPYDGAACRGFLIEVVAPITNDLPLIFENMTWDGGVQQGNQNVHGISVNEVDGYGWDQQHSAYLTFDLANRGGTATHQVLTNISVVRWRGESLKSIDQNTNGNLSIQHCYFGDICATALNIYPSWDVRNNVFSNCWQVTEYYQAYYTNRSYFCNNFITNSYDPYAGFAGNAVSINGGVWTAPPLVIQSNVLWNPCGAGKNVFICTPAANVSFLNNELRLPDYTSAFVMGTQGAQAPAGTIGISNILISGNSIYVPNKLVLGFGLGAGGINTVYGLTICSNYLNAPLGIDHVTWQNQYSQNLRFYYNTVDCPPGVFFQTGIAAPDGSQFLLVESNNNYTAYGRYLSTVTTNFLSYEWGPKTRLDQVATSNVFVLVDSCARQIPQGAFLEVDNRTNLWSLYGFGQADRSAWVTVYPSETMASSLILSNGCKMTFYWSGSAWTNDLAQGPAAPFQVNVGASAVQINGRITQP